MRWIRLPWMRDCRAGDVIRSVAGQEVASAEQFREVLLQLTPKETYSVTVMREGTKGYKKDYL